LRFYLVRVSHILRGFRERPDRGFFDRTVAGCAVTEL
jgi:hypothetical protein